VSPASTAARSRPIAIRVSSGQLPVSAVALVLQVQRELAQTGVQVGRHGGVSRRDQQPVLDGSHQLAEHGQTGPHRCGDGLGGRRLVAGTGVP
jgi:hypothetical protein